MKRLVGRVSVFLALSLLLTCAEEKGRHLAAPDSQNASGQKKEPAALAELPRTSPAADRSFINRTTDETLAWSKQGQARPGLLYSTMSDSEKREFLLRRARLISIKISGEPYQFNDDAIRYIKEYMDVYDRRVNNRSKERWGEDLNYIFARGQKYGPCISKAFRSHNVSPVIGLYIVAIETEFNNISSENSSGAAGLFQFIASTAITYGVAPGERTNLKKMADAAARYMGDRISEFGNDAMSVALAIASYNRSPDSIRRDLKEVLNAKGTNRERSFWTLVTNSDRLDKKFREENVKYVPKFFAIAIVGETPWAFRLNMEQALSTYETTSLQCPPR